jgi:hypothetical protein
MKKITLYLSLLSTLIFSSCDTNDDGFYNSVFVAIPNLIDYEIIDNPTGTDYVHVEGYFSSIQNEVGQTTPLDLFQTTGGATQFVFSYVIEKQINTTEWEVVTVPQNQLIVTDGEAEVGSFVYGICTYNPTLQDYEYNVKFPITSPGNYRLSFGYNSTSNNTVELVSLSAPSQLIVNINSAVIGLDSLGYTYFTLN